jgi:8-hydroxy-5-deazaflavin:NADPH oxidoreductase
VGAVAIIGCIGSGKIGSTVARLAVAAGHEVVLSNSRGPDTLLDLVADLGPLASAATPQEAAEQGELVLVSIPLRAYASVPVEPLADKPVMDTANYYPQRDGNIAALDDGSMTSSELLQRHLGQAKVVKVFNNINYRHLASLARPAGAPDRSALAIAGDDGLAKQAVADFLNNIGYDAVDAGPLGEGGRRFQVGTPAYGLPYGSMSDPVGTPAPVSVIEAVLARA